MKILPIIVTSFAVISLNAAVPILKEKNSIGHLIGGNTDLIELLKQSGKAISYGKKIHGGRRYGLLNGKPEANFTGYYVEFAEHKIRKKEVYLIGEYEEGNLNELGQYTNGKLQRLTRYKNEKFGEQYQRILFSSFTGKKTMQADLTPAGTWRKVKIDENGRRRPF